MGPISLDFECPTCGAEPGTFCRTKSGAHAYYHVPREQAARDARDAPPLTHAPARPTPWPQPPRHGPTRAPHADRARPASALNPRSRSRTAVGNTGERAQRGRVWSSWCPPRMASSEQRHASEPAGSTPGHAPPLRLWAGAVRSRWNAALRGLPLSSSSGPR
ncbi:zinc finger domain-containing protein [Streptomyces sp. NBC_01351]|uniref:zinc finger domain-containing protein n=1 Tax=Streptomyces sp. NBC_01351 TaxID=2903833 RepID=UPI003FCD7541